MPTVKVNGIELYYVSQGSGTPVILVHELAMDAGGWQHQIPALSRGHRVIALNLRGYPPSAVPPDPAHYGHPQLVDDLDAFMRALDIPRAFIVGHGTGGNIALSHALDKPDSVAGLVLVGAGAGNGNPGWKERSTNFSKAVAEQGIRALRDSLASAPQRLPLQRKNPAAWQAFLDSVEQLSAQGIANLMANGVRNRPMFSDLEDQIRRFSRPLLIMVGDRDTPALEPSLYLARTAAHAGLAVLPHTGHTLPLEEPELFNTLVSNFIQRALEGELPAPADRP